MKFSVILLYVCAFACVACVEGSSANAQSSQQKIGTSVVSVDSIYVPLAAGLRIEGESAELLYNKLVKYIAPVIEPNSGISSVIGKNIACSFEQSKYWCGLIVQATDGSTEPDSIVGGTPKIGGGN